MTDKPNWRGIFAIPMTPWTERDTIDEDCLRAEIDYICESCNGLLAPLLVSEFQVLSEAEHRLMMRLSVEQTRKRVPVIVNVAAENVPLAVEYARYAREIGADGVIAMPPYALRPDYEVIYAYFKAINDAAQMPIWIQNANIVPLSTDQVIKLCTEIEHAKWVKEEVTPTPRSIGALCARQSPQVHGVMGGVGGLYLPTEFARGAAGCIVACEACDLIQRMWDLLEAGKANEARELFERVQPLVVLENLLGMGFAKEIMVRRGIFKNHKMRMQVNPLSADDLREIDAAWERVQPLLATA